MSTVTIRQPAPAPAAPAEHPRRRIRLGRVVLPAYSALVILYTLIPIAVMVAYGFNQAPSGRLTFAWQGFTTQWYQQVFAIANLTTALEHSLELAFSSTAIALAIGTPLSLALARYRFRGRGVTDATIFLDIAAPEVVVGAALLSFFISLNIPRGLVTILIAHVAFNIAFVTVVVRARVLGLDRALDRAASDLGANPWTAFWKVTFPLILPGILAGGLLAFAMSIDDFIITEFVAGQTVTFPLWVYGAVKVGIPPQVFVMGTLIFLGGIILAAINVIFQRRDPVSA
jgi:spermidine/putrescine transport system permease protein